MIDTLLLVPLKTIKNLSMQSKAATYLLNFLLHDFLWLIFSWKSFPILLISSNQNFVWSAKFVLSISFIFEIAENYSVIFPKVMRRKQIRKISQLFTCKHKINESNAEVAAHYWIVCLYPKNVSFNVFMSNRFFHFFRNMFNTKTIKINNFTFVRK